MKNTLLCGALLSLICAQVQADPATPQTTIKQPVTNDNTNPAAVVVPATTNSKVIETTPTTTTVQPIQTLQNGQQTPTVQPANTQPVTTVQPQVAPVINCDYKIPAQTKIIDQSLIKTWSEKATVQAFDFDAASMDGQLLKLQACFTEQGWSGFNTALQKSGNLDAIKTQKLKVSSHIDGEAQVTEAKDNQWKVTLPLQVIYQNDKEKVTQLLTVNLTIGRKNTGDLGIIQMIATPRPLTSSVTPNPINHQVTASIPSNKAPVPTSPDDDSSTPPDNTDSSTAPAATDSNANTNTNTNTSPNTNQQQPGTDSTTNN